MKKLLYIFLLFSSSLLAQNLIPNGDFELGPDSSSSGWYDGVFDTIGGRCSPTVVIGGPDFWTVTFGSPDRMVDTDLPICNWDTTKAQSGNAYVLFAGGSPGGYEAGKTTLISPLQKDSIYQLSCYVSLQTFRGYDTLPHRVAFVFNNSGDSLISPLVNLSGQWIYFDTIFVASANSTELEIKGNAFASSATNVDNISLIKIKGTAILDYVTLDKKIIIYPNPSTGIFQIDYNDNAGIRIYNSVGREVSYSSISKNEKSIDLSYLPKGFYFFKLITKKELIIQKILLTN